MALKPIAPVASTLALDGASGVRNIANRAHAQPNPSPRTPEGQAHASPHALQHGGFPEYGRPAAALPGQDRGEFDARLEELREEYAPAGRHEAWMVERIALLWGRLERLGAAAQTRLAARLDHGADPVEALLEAEAIAPAEARLERALDRLHKHLLGLRRERERAREKAARRSARTPEGESVTEVAAELEAVLRDPHLRRQAVQARADYLLDQEDEAERAGDPDGRPREEEEAGKAEDEKTDKPAV